MGVVELTTPDRPRSQQANWGSALTYTKENTIINVAAVLHSCSASQSFAVRTPSVNILAQSCAGAEGTAKVEWVIRPTPSKTNETRQDSEALVSAEFCRGTREPPDPHPISALPCPQPPMQTSNSPAARKHTLQLFDEDSPLSCADLDCEVCIAADFKLPAIKLTRRRALCTLQSSTTLQNCSACILAFGQPVSCCRSRIRRSHLDGLLSVFLFSPPQVRCSWERLDSKI